MDELLKLAELLKANGAVEDAALIEKLAAEADEPSSPVQGDKAQFEAPEEYNARVMRESPSLEQWTKDIQEELSLYLKNPEEKVYYDLLDALKQYQVRWMAEKGVSASVSLEAVLDKLSGVADKLDGIGLHKEADAVDNFIKKTAEDVMKWKEEADTEQSKRYDSDYHHSLQVREPKREQERVDREGRKNHHVHTYQQTNATALSTRHCPEHVGVSLARVGEATYQCALDGKVYNWEAGWEDYDGNKHPGSSVAAQTPDSVGYATPHRLFDTRENIMNLKG